MLSLHHEPSEKGADDRAKHHEADQGRGVGSLVPPLSLPKNRSTGNLALTTTDMTTDTTTDTTTDRPRYRMSFDAPSLSAIDHDALARSPHMGDHEHGSGLSGLRRIRQQHPPSRHPTLPSSAVSSRSHSVAALSRSTSMSGVVAGPGSLGQSGGPASPSFSEDLSRFPSESLHSFSFAHQSEEFIHNRQSVLKRSMDFIKDRLGWSINSTQAGLASAQARVTGDADTQNMLHLLARANLIGAGNLPNADACKAVGPLTGPAQVTGENWFDRQFTSQPLDTATAASDAASPTTLDPAKTGLDDGYGVDGENDDAGVQSQTAPTKPWHPGHGSEQSSRTPTNESGTTAQTSPPLSRPTSLKRTLTDTLSITVQDKLIETMDQPFLASQQMVEEPASTSPLLPFSLPSALGSAVHGHTNRWVPAAQAIFTTEAKPPWTIIAANDLACLVFGVTKAEMRKMGILEVVQQERRAWLERKLLRGDDGDDGDDDCASAVEGATAKTPGVSAAATLLGRRTGITAQLLSKPNSRCQSQRYTGRRAQTVHSGDANPPKTRGSGQHRNKASRGVLLCGDVVPIQKRNGATGSASLWVKEKRVGLIWVLEEIHEDVAYVQLDDDGIIQGVSGATEPIWGSSMSHCQGLDVATLIPRIPRQGIDPTIGEIDFAQVSRQRYFACPNSGNVDIPCMVEQTRVEETRGSMELRVSTFPHMAGIVVVDPEGLKIRSSNSVFCGALFGYEKPDGLSIECLVPDFGKILQVMTDEDGLQILDGMVVPEQRFRRAWAFLALKEHRPTAAAAFLQPDGLPARHRHGSELKIDVQMRVVESEKQPRIVDETVVEASDEDRAETPTEEAFATHRKEMVFALWITYSRHVHAHAPLHVDSPAGSGELTPLHQPSPGQTPALHSPMDMTSDDDETRKAPSPAARQPQHAAPPLSTPIPPKPKPAEKAAPTASVAEPAAKTTIHDYNILEDMGQGAYGQVKLARHKRSGNKIVLKYVTKRRILVDTWTRDRKLGTVPLEIHVLDYLRRPEFRHPNIVEMQGFFEDDINYYIEMAPHGLPGMDLFDYIELRANMDEAECRSIFVQVAQAIHFLHAKALVVHRDIKDENVILDGEGNIKLIDFGSAAYIKSGPFDVFVGTIDYAAPEVLAGKPYGGKEQDVWALGILLYTIIYKENPFYSIDEIMDRDLRVPFTISDESIDLVRCMLNRDVEARYNTHQVLKHAWCQAPE